MRDEPQRKLSPGTADPSRVRGVGREEARVVLGEGCLRPARLGWVQIGWKVSVHRGCTCRGQARARNAVCQRLKYLGARARRCIRLSDCQSIPPGVWLARPSRLSGFRWGCRRGASSRTQCDALRKVVAGAAHANCRQEQQRRDGQRLTRAVRQHASHPHKDSSQRLGFAGGVPRGQPH